MIDELIDTHLLIDEFIDILIDLLFDEFIDILVDLWIDEFNIDLSIY